MLRTWGGGLTQNQIWNPVPGLKNCFLVPGVFLQIVSCLDSGPVLLTDSRNIYMVQYATFQYFYIWVWPNRFYSGFSTELSFDLFVKRKNVLESQMASKSFTWKIMTMGRGYLPELLRFILTFLKNISPLRTKITIY